MAEGFPPQRRAKILKKPERGGKGQLQRGSCIRGSLAPGDLRPQCRVAAERPHRGCRNGANISQEVWLKCFDPNAEVSTTGATMKGRPQRGNQIPGYARVFGSKISSQPNAYIKSTRGTAASLPQGGNHNRADAFKEVWPGATGRRNNNEAAITGQPQWSK